MLKQLKDYAKCAVRNKVTLGSYVGLGLACLIKYVENKAEIQLPIYGDLLLITSALILQTTKFGTETYSSYRRTRKHIEKHGTIEERFKNKFSPLYCTQTGVRMAAEEAKLEKLL